MPPRKKSGKRKKKSSPKAAPKAATAVPSKLELETQAAAAAAAAKKAEEEAAARAAAKHDEEAAAAAAAAADATSVTKNMIDGVVRNVLAVADAAESAALSVAEARAKAATEAAELQSEETQGRCQPEDEGVERAAARGQADEYTRKQAAFMQFLHETMRQLLYACAPPSALAACFIRLLATIAEALLCRASGLWAVPVTVAASTR